MRAGLKSFLKSLNCCAATPVDEGPAEGEAPVRRQPSSASPHALKSRSQKSRSKERHPDAAKTQSQCAEGRRPSVPLRVLRKLGYCRVFVPVRDPRGGGQSRERSLGEDVGIAQGDSPSRSTNEPLNQWMLQQHVAEINAHLVGVPAGRAVAVEHSSVRSVPLHKAPTRDPYVVLEGSQLTRPYAAKIADEEDWAKILQAAQQASNACKSLVEGDSDLIELAPEQLKLPLSKSNSFVGRPVEVKVSDDPPSSSRARELTGAKSHTSLQDLFDEEPLYESQLVRLGSRDRQLIPQPSRDRPALVRAVNDTKPTVVAAKQPSAAAVIGKDTRAQKFVFTAQRPDRSLVEKGKQVAELKPSLGVVQRPVQVNLPQSEPVSDAVSFGRGEGASSTWLGQQDRSTPRKLRRIPRDVSNGLKDAAKSTALQQQRAVPVPDAGAPQVSTRMLAPEMLQLRQGRQVTATQISGTVYREATRSAAALRPKPKIRPESPAAVPRPGRSSERLPKQRGATALTVGESVGPAPEPTSSARELPQIRQEGPLIPAQIVATTSVIQSEIQPASPDAIPEPTQPASPVSHVVEAMSPTRRSEGEMVSNSLSVLEQADQNVRQTYLPDVNETWQRIPPSAEEIRTNPLSDLKLTDVSLSPPPDHIPVDTDALEAQEHERRCWEVAARRAPESTLKVLTAEELVTRDEMLRELAKNFALPYFSSDTERIEFEKLEEEYVVRAVKINSRRKKAFGSAQPYQLHKDMTTFTLSGALSVLFESFKSMVTSAFRTPSGNLLTLPTKGNKNFFPVDQGLLNATIQGAMAYVAEGAVEALSHVAELSNMPKIVANNFEGLFYEHGVTPDTVLLDLKNNVRQYRLASDLPVLTPEELNLVPKKLDLILEKLDLTPERLDERAAHQVSHIKWRQDLLEGKSYASTVNPLMSGLFNTLRRIWSSTSTIENAPPLIVSSALASGGASGVTTLGQGVWQTRAQVEIDNMVGGRQKVNLFQLKLPQANTPAVQLSDIRGMPSLLKNATHRAVSVAGAALRNWGSSLGDLSGRYMLVNGVANVAGMGAGGLTEMVLRKGRGFSPLPGESLKSPAQVIGQLIRSTVGDGTWRAMIKWLRGREMKNSTSQDLRDLTRLAKYQRAAELVAHTLRVQLDEAAPEDSPLWTLFPQSETPDAPNTLRKRLMRRELMDVEGWQQARNDLNAIKGAAPSWKDPVQSQIDSIIDSLKARGKLAERVKSKRD